MMLRRKRWAAAVVTSALVGLVTSEVSAAIDELGFVDSKLDVPASVSQVVGDVFPESSQIGSSYLSGTYTPNLLVTQDAQIWVTFVHEGAGYKNTLGYFTYRSNGSSIEILDRQLVFPNASYADPSLGWGGGQLAVGDTVSLRDAQGAVRTFSAGDQIAFFLVANGWDGSNVRGWDPLSPAIPTADSAGNQSAGIYTTIDELNPEAARGRIDVARHFATVRVGGIAEFLGGEPFFLLGLEDLPRDGGSDEDFNDLVTIIRSNPLGAIDTTSAPTYQPNDPDPDGDGVEGLEDYFPNDAERALVVRTPATSYQTIAFEDTYPEVGDADFNDVVVQYAVEEVLDASGRVKDLVGTYHLTARGATLDHRFGVAVHGIPLGTLGTVEVERISPDGVSSTDPVAALGDFLAENEDGTLHVRLDHLFESTTEALPPLSGSYATNTLDPSALTPPASVRFVVTFDTAIERDPLGIPPYDPFIQIVRGAELWDVHMPGQRPFVGRPAHLRAEDGAITFLDDEFYPWVLLVPYDWRYPLERQRIDGALPAYPQFATWRNSLGMLGTDWYVNPETSTPDSRVVDSLSDANRTRPWTISASN